MKNKFRSVSLSYKNTPVKIREVVALNDSESQRLLHKIKDLFGAEDLFILSTCNRTEIYYSSERDLSGEIIKLIAIEKAVDFSEINEYFIRIDNSRKAAEHLFKVAIGLESQVVGDLQIINQVKRAYQQSAEEDVAGPYLHRLMHSIFYTNKRVVQETSFRDGAASVSYATVSLIEDLGANIINPHILVVGVGEIGKDVVRNLKEFGFENVTIINRTLEKAQSLAEECGYKVGDFDNLNKLISGSEIIVSSIQTKKPLITSELLKGIDIPGYKHFFDLSIPRSIDSDIEKIAGVSLHNIDHIKAKTDEALEKRLEAAEKVEELIMDSLVEFNEWSKEMLVSPTLKKFKNALEEIRQEELKKYLKKLDKREAKMVDNITKSIMQKIVKLPALNLKAACKRDEAENLAEVLNELFNLEKQPEKKK